MPRPMKKLFITAIILLTISTLASAQTTTIILFRHAEKDTSAAGSTAMKADPPLSADGLKRADRIPGVLIAYQPDSIYSTDYTRTKSTMAPLARKFNLGIQIYDPRNQAAFAERLLQNKGKVMVVAGHSNSIPALVNLLIKENRYPSLDESIYNQFWIVTIRDGKAEAVPVKY